MKILIALTYYRPHVSGLTIYVERLARALVLRGHAVTVLTSQYERSLAAQETLLGVHVVRVPVVFRVSKGVVMPTIGLEATRQVLKHDALSVHLPQLDAWGIALRGRLFGRPTLLTYHCDLRLPRGLLNAAANVGIKVANNIAATFSDRVVAYTKDYAIHTPFLRRYLRKLRVIPPPVEVAQAEEGARSAFAHRWKADGGPLIGMAARLATEKGVEYLLEALPLIRRRYPGAKVLFAGQYEDVFGEAEYRKSLQPRLDAAGASWVFLGLLDPVEMAAFYHACDVTVLPSINSTESFGMVQIESMLCGTPVVASDLPGVRFPVRSTGMGRIVPPHNPEALVAAVLEILERPEGFAGDAKRLAQEYAPDETARRYEALFLEIRRETGSLPPE